MGAWCLVEPTKWSQLEFSVPALTSREGRWARDWVQSPMANDLINHAMWWSVHKNPRGRGWWAHGNLGKVACLEGAWMSTPFPFASPHALWLFLVIFFYSNPMIYWVNHLRYLLQQINSIQSKDHGAFWLITSRSEVQITSLWLTSVGEGAAVL